MSKVLVLILFYSFSAAASDFTVHCEKFPKPFTGGFCIHIPTEKASNDFVYYLHGSGLDEFAWQDKWYYTAQVRKEWDDLGTGIPTVISVSFGPVWLLAEKNASPASGLLETFVSKIIPQIETELGGLKGRRIVLGESMGGFNSAQLALKTDRFQKAAILCAPMADISPFSAPSEIDAYIKKSSAWQYYKDSKDNPIPDSVADIMKLTQTFFPSNEDWKKADPLYLAQLSKPATAFYIAVGFYDRFVAFEGNEKFVGILKSKGANVQWRPQWGGHCAIDIPSLAAFLVN